MKKLIAVALVLSAAVSLQAKVRELSVLRPHALLAGDMPDHTTMIHSSKWFFKRWAPHTFTVARPESFEDYDQFKTSILDYDLNHDVDTVWQQYLSINPLRIWSTNRARITAAYVPSLDATLDRDAMEQGWPGFEQGMKIFVDMSSLPWAVSNKPAMMVALEIVVLDHEQKLVVFRYLKGTPSYGEQRMSFRPAPGNPDATHVDHDTWFRSYSKVIEKFYPSYHRKMINQMHARFAHAIDADVGP